MAAFGQNIGRVFVLKALAKFYRKSVFPYITHDEYSPLGGGDIKKTIKKQGQQFQIEDITLSGLKSYSGADIVAGTPSSTVSILNINQRQALHEFLPDDAVFASQIENPDWTLLEQAADLFEKTLDGYLLGFHSKAKAGSWLGTSYTTGTVTVTAVTGAVVGVGTTFTAGMVGKPFRAVGHSQWYRVKTWTNATNIVIEDDQEDEASAYTGGAIAGAAYEIQGNTPIAITGANFFPNLVNLGGYLDKFDVPDKNRWMVLPMDAKQSLLNSNKINPVLDKVLEANVEGTVYKDTVNNFRIMFSNRVPGDNVAGYEIIAGHKAFLGAGFGMISPISTVDTENNFGKKLKALFGYGAKVADARRKFGAKLFATFAP